MLANLIQAIAVILDGVLKVYNLIVLVAVLLTWVHPDPFNPIVRFLRAMTEPVFEWVRRRLPFIMVGTLDLSPIAVFLCIWFLRMFLVGSLLELSIRLR